MAYTVERFATGPQARRTFADYNLALAEAKQYSGETGQEYAIFDGDHNLQEVVMPERSRSR